LKHVGVTYSGDLITYEKLLELIDIVNAQDVHVGIRVHNVKTQNFTHFLTLSCNMFVDCNDLVTATSEVKC
jgi:hypothetical protein